MLFSKLLNDDSRGIDFRSFLKNHNKYNVIKSIYSKYHIDELWAKTSKAGLEFQTLIRNKVVMFCVDGIIDSVKKIANKSIVYGCGITASELRWVYRNKNNEQIMILFARKRNTRRENFVLTGMERLSSENKKPRLVS